MNDRFLKFCFWLRDLPFTLLRLPAFLTKFPLPKWAQGAWQNIWMVIVALFLLHGAPTVGKIFLGFIVLLESGPIILLFFWAFGWTAFFVDRCLRQPTVPPSQTMRDFMQNIMQNIMQKQGGGLGLFSSLLLFAWGLFTLLDIHIRWFRLGIMIVWAVYVLAGCILALADILRRRRPPLTPA